MTTLIEDLIERTRAYVPDAQPGDAEFMQKFAEIVVLECEAEIVNNIGSESEQFDDGLRKAASTITSYFDIVEI